MSSFGRSQVAFTCWLFLSLAPCSKSPGETPVDDQLFPGCRVMIVEADAVETIDSMAPMASYAGHIAKVVSVDASELTVRDEFGMGTVSRGEVILLRRADALDQISSRIGEADRRFAIARFHALFDLQQGWSMMEQVIDEQPNHDWAKAWFAKITHRQDRERSRELLSGLDESSSAWPLASILIAAQVGDPAIALANLAKQYPKNAHAQMWNLDAMVKGIEHGDSSRQTKLGQMIEVFRSLAALEQIYPFSVEVADLSLRASFARDKLLQPLTAEKRSAIIGVATDALKLDRFDPELMVNIAAAEMYNANYESAAKIAWQAASNFPRTPRAVWAFAMHGSKHPKQLMMNFEDIELRVNSMAYDWDRVFEGVESIKDTDIPRTVESVPYRLIDGHGRRDGGWKIDPESGMPAISKLCANDNTDCLRFLDQHYQKIDYRFPETVGESLAHTCVRVNAWRTLAFLADQKVPLNLADTNGVYPIDAAIEGGAINCVQLLWTEGMRPSQAAKNKLCRYLNCHPDQIESHLLEESVNELVKQTDAQLQAIVADLSTAKAAIATGKEAIQAAKWLQQNGVGSGPAPNNPAPVFVSSQFKNNPAMVNQAIQQAVEDSLPLVTDADRRKWAKMEKQGRIEIAIGERRWVYSSKILAMKYLQESSAAKRVLGETNYVNWERAMIDRQCETAVAIKEFVN